MGRRATDATEKPVVKTIDATENETPTRLMSRSIELVTDAKEFHRILNATNKLTDEAFEGIVNDIGFRLALLHMRRAAVIGNVQLAKSCQIYLDRCDRSRSRKNQPGRTADGVASSAAFLVTPRQITGESEQD